jgi:hypothetical protein
MRIKILKTVAGPSIVQGGHFENEVCHVPDQIPLDIARDMLKRGYAVEIPDEPTKAENEV